MHQYAEKVRDGIIDDPSFLPILFSAPAEDEEAEIAGPIVISESEDPADRARDMG